MKQEFTELKLFAKRHDICPYCRNPLKNPNSPSGSGGAWANHHCSCKMWDIGKKKELLLFQSPERMWEILREIRIQLRNSSMITEDEYNQLLGNIVCKCMKGEKI